MADSHTAARETGVAGPTRRTGASRFGVHYVYYALAAFVVVALSLSVTILVWITSSYRHSVAVNEYWAERMRQHWSLTDLASRANAPGNDAFRRAGDRAVLDMHEATLDRALADFETERSALAAALADRPDPSIGADLATTLGRVAGPMARMGTESRSIFGHLRGGRVREAGVHMASMDEAYSRALGHLRDSSAIVVGIQRANLEDQLRIVERLQRVELVLAAVILFTVGMVTVYGRTLARRMRDFQTELTQYRDHLEALVGERTAELEASLERLRASDRLASIGSLAAGLGHDMNNVLFPVRCWLDALAEADLDDSGKAEVASIRQSVEYLQQLSDGLRLLALDPEQDAAEPGATELQGWWDDVRPLFLTALPKEATLKGEIALGLPPVGLARHQLTQAVFNLVVNAGAAIEESGTVRVWARRGDGDDVVSIGVTDDGHGMTEDVRHQALDPFFTTKKRGLSTGLGLGLVQGVTKAVGGRVEIDSAPGRGTTVTLSLPLVAVETHGAPTATEHWATVSIQDRRVATFAASLLRSAGFGVTEIGNETVPRGSLWVTDRASRAEALASFVGGAADRHVIVLGAADAAGADANLPGVWIVDEKGGLGAMRQAIQDVVRRLSEQHP